MRLSVWAPVIRGNTPHFDYIASEVSKGIAAIGMEIEVPVIFGVLTTDTIEQAVERRGYKERQQGLGRGAVGHRNGRFVEETVVRFT